MMRRRKSEQQARDCWFFLHRAGICSHPAFRITKTGSHLRSAHGEARQSDGNDHVADAQGDQRAPEDEQLELGTGN